MSAGVYTVAIIGGDEGVVIEVKTIGVRENYEFSFPSSKEMFDPRVIRDETGIGFYYEDGRWQFYPWANVSECLYAPAPTTGDRAPAVASEESPDGAR